MTLRSIVLTSLFFSVCACGAPVGQEVATAPNTSSQALSLPVCGCFEDQWAGAYNMCCPFGGAANASGGCTWENGACGDRACSAGETCCAEAGLCVAEGATCPSASTVGTECPVDVLWCAGDPRSGFNQGYAHWYGYWETCDDGPLDPELN